MSIGKIREKIKSYENDIFIVLIIILVAVISFGLGRLSKIKENKTPINIENTPASVITPTDPTDESVPTKGMLVGSKNSDKYHYPWCSGAQGIKEENKIWFSSREEAESSGYTPAANCKGL